MVVPVIGFGKKVSLQQVVQPFLLAKDTTMTIPLMETEEMIGVMQDLVYSICVLLPQQLLRLTWPLLLPQVEIVNLEVTPLQRVVQ